MPAAVERLNAEIHALKVQLRRKHEQAELAEKKAADLEHRYILLQQRKGTPTAASVGAPSVNGEQNNPGATGNAPRKNQAKAIEGLKASLEKEQHNSLVSFRFGAFLYLLKQPPLTD